MAFRNSKGIAKNILFLYGQMLLSMLIGLYTSRVIINVLGIEDFGIYNVVGGVVTMFGILNSAMSSSTSRFLTFEIGNGDLEKLKDVFSTALVIHIGIGLAVVLLGEPIGLWFMKNEMRIPLQRFDAAQWVFHCALATTIVSIINVPYTAVIIAHERMNIFAYISTIDVVLKLAIVFLLPIFPYDKLICYAVLLLLTQLIVQFIYWIHCHRHFTETKGQIKWNKSLFKELSSFAGWSLFGDSAVMMMTQGVNILLNIFFGATINAGRGIAVQVQGVMTRFISNFQMALNPQLTKSYAKNDLQYMRQLVFASSKYSFFLFLILALPIYLDTQNILIWWLKIVPDYTVYFVRILLLISLVDCLANPLIISAKAVGNIKIYQSILGSLLLLIVPISYIALKLGYPPESVFIVHLIIVSIGHAIRVRLIKPMINLSLKQYLYEVVFRCGLILILAPIIPYFIFQHLPSSLFRFGIIGFVSFITVGLLVYLFGMNRYEKNILLKKYRV